MKNKLQFALVACAMLATTTSLHAAPKCADRHAAQIHTLCQNKEARIMMIRELMNTKQGKEEMTQMLEHDGDEEFRSYYETHNVNPG